MRIKIELKQKNKPLKEGRKHVFQKRERENVTHLRENTAGFLHHPTQKTHSHFHSHAATQSPFTFIVISASTLAEQQIVR